MAVIELVTVQRDGTPGATVGSLELGAAGITTRGDAAQGLLDQLRRHTRLSDEEIFARLTSDGWSNGHVMTRTA